MSFDLRKAKEVTGYKKGKAFPLVVIEVAPDKYLESKAAWAFVDMSRAAEKDGITLHVNSAFRFFDHQKRLFDRWVASGRTGPRPATPGYSNHHSGIAVDINRAHDDPDGRGPIIGATDAWLDANAFRFGFVSPYSWEPWHWEYRPEECAL